MYEPLTDYLQPLRRLKKVGVVRGEIYDDEGNVVKMTCPYMDYCPTVKEFIKAVIFFNEDHPEFKMMNYMKTLKTRGIFWSMETMKSCDVAHADSKTILSLLMGLIRGEFFSTGIIGEYFCEGYIFKWLERLKQLDDKAKVRAARAAARANGASGSSRAPPALLVLPANHKNRSRADFPTHYRIVGLCLAKYRKKQVKKDSRKRLSCIWRRRRDSNPRAHERLLDFESSPL